MNVIEIIDEYLEARMAAYKQMGKALVSKNATCAENGVVTRQGKITRVWIDDRGEYSALMILIDGNVNPVCVSMHYHDEDELEVTID